MNVQNTYQKLCSPLSLYCSPSIIFGYQSLKACESSKNFNAQELLYMAFILNFASTYSEVLLFFICHSSPKSNLQQFNKYWPTRLPIPSDS